MVDAVRAVRALEDGDVLEPSADMLSGDFDEADPESSHRAEKRRKTDQEPQPAAQDNIQSAGLLSNEVLDGLRHLAAQRKSQQATVPVSASKTTLGGLGDYGSDEE